jgi:hypothetical protein
VSEFFKVKSLESILYPERVRGNITPVV